MHFSYIIGIRMKNGTNGGYKTLKRLKLILTVGCMMLCTMHIPVCAASLEDSMLKPPSSQSEKADDDTKQTSSFAVRTGTITTAAELVDLDQEERIWRIGQMCQEDYEKSGVLASVSAAQCILESGYLTTELATEANNCFGMKASLSGNDWQNSTWDGESLYTKQTGEEYGGKDVTIVADFRQYDCIEDSVADHSAYLLGATVDGGGLRYAGLEGETDYRKAIEIIKDGGYATDSSYVDKVCRIIERYDLTRFDEIHTEYSAEDEKADKKDGDKKDSNKAQQDTLKAASADKELYRVRKTWEDASSQLGAFESLENAREVCREGYHVFDSQGNIV